MDALVCRSRHALNELGGGALVLGGGRCAPICGCFIAVRQKSPFACCLGRLEFLHCLVLIPDLACYLGFLTAAPCKRTQQREQITGLLPNMHCSIPHALLSAEFWSRNTAGSSVWYILLPLRQAMPSMIHGSLVHTYRLCHGM